MQATSARDCPEEPSDAPASRPPCDGRECPPGRRYARAVSLGAMLLFFAADIVLPRGATPAIGYCLVLVLARATDRRGFLLAMTGICSALTWVGYAVEPAGAAWWMSVFERAMVTGVLWLTLLLVWRRMQAEAALAHQARALREAVAELRRSNAELQSFASVVAHDIRAPLNSVGLLVDLMAAQPPVRADAQCGECVDSILSEIARMSGMIQGLLAYGRVGAGAVRRSDCDCDAVLAGVRRALRAELEAAGARVTNDPLPTVRGDPALIAELFQNLVENAVKYRGRAAPVVHVWAARAPGGWRFSVRDNGAGIPREDCGRVFDPFYRGTAVRESHGIGLGLATCRRIVERHGGSIDVQSTPGQGSTFTFVIPDPPATAPTPPRTPPDAPSRWRRRDAVDTG